MSLRPSLAFAPANVVRLDPAEMLGLQVDGLSAHFPAAAKTAASAPF
jgi:hypothetical protein